MLTSIVQTAAPALRNAGQFMSPIAKAAVCDAIKHTTEVVITYGGAVLVGITGHDLYPGGWRAMHCVKTLSHPPVKVAWEPDLTITDTASAAPGACIEPHKVGPVTIDGAVTPAT